MSLEHLKQIGISKKYIKPAPTNYTIESSTEIKTNCIEGSIKLKIFLLEENSQFYDSSINFLVSNDTIKLSDIILGLTGYRNMMQH